MTFYDGRPIGTDDAGTALKTLIQASLAHVKDAVDQEHVWSDSDPTLTVHDATLFKCKVGYFTRDLTASSGDVAYNAVGFAPQVILFYASYISVSGNRIGSFGAATASGAANAAVTYLLDTLGTQSVSGGNTNVIGIYTSGLTTGQTAVLKSVESTGFTLTWTKILAPTGTAYVTYVALRFSA